MGKLIAIRHGQSTWNAENRFTGWVDVDLSEKGVAEAEKSGKLIKELNTNDEIITICHHGMRSFQVCNYLEENGFDRVSNLDGGIDAWAKTIDQDMEQY